MPSPVLSQTTSNLRDIFKCDIHVLTKIPETLRKGILTNIIHPCVIETDLLRERYHDETAKQGLVAQIPAGRLGRPEDIAGLVAYLASPWGDYICGQAILVDGGRTVFG